MYFLILPLAISAYNYMNHGSDWTQGYCATGTNQSPISILESQCTQVNSPPWFLNIENYAQAIFSPKSNITQLLNTYLSMSSNGINLGYATKDTATSTGTNKYYINSINFHVPAEHLLNGVRYSMEIQIYHTSATDGSFLVLSVLFNSTSDTDYQRLFLTNFLTANSGSGQVDPVDLVLGYYQVKQFYYYQGSLSMPNCNPAEWIIWDTPLPVLNTQFQQIQAILQNGTTGNYRSLQTNANTVQHFHGSYAFAGYLVVIGLGFLVI